MFFFFSFLLVDKYLCNMFLIPFLLYYRQIKKIGPQRENLISSIFAKFTGRGSCVSLGSCDAVRHGRLFCGMLCRSCRYGSTACLLLCKASLSHTHTQRPAEEGLQSPPSESHKEETLLG